jgi:DNA-binding FrmR family transcriptional regulator
MIDEDRYCPDILIQLSSVQEALRNVGRALLRNHLRHCVTKGLREGSADRAETIYGELLDLIYQHSR